MSTSDQKNVKTAVTLFAIAGGMIGLAFASVPLYQLFCQVTGYGGTTVNVATKPKKELAVDSPIITVLLILMLIRICPGVSVLTKTKLEYV